MGIAPSGLLIPGAAVGHAFVQVFMGSASRLLCFVLLALLLPAPSVSALEETPVAAALSDALSLPISEWRSSSGTTRAYLIAIHGLSLHGRVYSRLASELNVEGVTVIAPDLRGYGKWYLDSCDIDYERSLNDLSRILVELRRRDPETPVFVVGESLGGSLGIRLAAKHPELLNGLILSAPGVVRHRCLPLKMVPSCLHVLVDNKHQLNITKYLRQHFSNEQAIVAERLSDEQLRTKFSLKALWSTCKIVRQTLGAAHAVPSYVPVLILQGSRDKMLDPHGAQRLRVSFARHDADLLVLPKAGHILLETSKPDAQAVDAVSKWLSKQIYRNGFVASVHGEVVSPSLNSDL